MNKARIIFGKTEKQCTKCKQIFPIESFGVRGGRDNSIRPACKTCVVKQTREYQVLNKESVAERQRNYCKANRHKSRKTALKATWKRHGHNGEKILNLYETRPERCQICDRKCKTFLDHCHNSMILRGWLCNRCNMAIGFFKDNPKSCENAAIYLRNPPLKDIDLR
jgi:hypothetical protein